MLRPPALTAKAGARLEDVAEGLWLPRQRPHWRDPPCPPFLGCLLPSAGRAGKCEGALGTGERVLPELGTVPTKASWKWGDLRGGGHMGGSAFWVGEHRGGAAADTEPSVSASYVEGRTTGLC